MNNEFFGSLSQWWFANPEKTKNVRVEKNIFLQLRVPLLIRFGDRTSSKWYLLTSYLHYGDGIAA